MNRKQSLKEEANERIASTGSLNNLMKINFLYKKYRKKLKEKS